MAKEKKSFFESPIMRTQIRSSTVSLFPEAALGYLLGPVLALLCNGVINVWLVQYWDKVLRLGELAPVFETVLPIVSAIVIVVGNLLVGRLMERKPTMAGKARPLILLGMPVIAISLLVMFLFNVAPGTTDTEVSLVTLAMVAVGYNLFYAIAWPIYYTSHSALINLSTRDSGKRGLLSTCIMAAQLGAAGLAGMAGGILVDLIGLLPRYEYVENGVKKVANAVSDIPVAFQNSYVEAISPAEANSKWVILMIIMVAALVVGCLLEYYFSRERITEEQVRIEKTEGAANKTVKKVSMAEQAKVCVKDKLWWIIIIFFFLYQFGGMMKNNGMSFYSQAMTGGNSLSSLINTVGAIPTAAGMAIVWPIAFKIGKKKTIIFGGFLALFGAAMAFLGLIPALNQQVIFTFLDTPLTSSGVLAVVAFIVKALGTAPAMYIALSVMASVLDHQEAVYGIRTDGFTMAVYGSIMVAMSGVCNGIIVGLNAAVPQGAKQFLHTFLSFGVEGIAYVIMSILFFGMNVERFEKLDKKAIAQDQKEVVLAAGGEWVEPDERARLEDEENDRLVVEANLAQMKVRCEKKHLDYEAESKAYLEKHDKELADKKAKAEADKKKAEEAYEKLPDSAKAKRKAIDEESLRQLNELRAKNNRPAVNA